MIEDSHCDLLGLFWRQMEYNDQKH